MLLKSFACLGGIAFLLVFEPVVVFSQDSIRDDSALQKRPGEALSFGEKLLNRELTFIAEWSEFADRKAFDTRTVDLPVEGGKERTVGAVRDDRKVCWTLELGAIPTQPHSQLIKVIASNNRVCNINYVGTDTTQIDSFTEAPLPAGEFDAYASVAGQGIWFGYLMRRKFPEFRRLNPKIKWEPSSNGETIVGAFDAWQFTFQFADASDSQPLRVEMQNRNQQSATRGTTMARTLEFLEWQEVDGVNVPKKVAAWNLVKGEEDAWTTTRSLLSLENVGPIIQMSDRYRDFFRDVPDNSQVTVEDDRSIHHIWKNGEIVENIGNINQNPIPEKPLSASPMFRNFLVANGLIVLGIIVLVVWRRRRAT